MNQAQNSFRWKNRTPFTQEKKGTNFQSFFVCQTLKIAFFIVVLAAYTQEYTELFCCWSTKNFSDSSLYSWKYFALFFSLSGSDIHAHKYWNVAYFQFNWFRLSVCSRACVCLALFRICEFVDRQSGKEKEKPEKKTFFFPSFPLFISSFCDLHVFRHCCKDAHKATNTRVNNVSPNTVDLIADIQ